MRESSANRVSRTSGGQPAGELGPATSGDRGAYRSAAAEAAPPLSFPPDVSPMAEVRRLRAEGLPLTPVQRAVEAAYQQTYLSDRYTIRPTEQEHATWPGLAREAGYRGVAPWLLFHARRSIGGLLADPARDRARAEEVEGLRRECERLEQENAALRQERLDEGEWARRIIDSLAAAERAASKEEA